MTLHRKTPVLTVTDPRGLTIRSVAYWRCVESAPVESRVERSVHDEAGRAVEHWDARLWALQISDPMTPANLHTVYSLTGHVVRTVSVDAGMQIELRGSGAEILRGWDSREIAREVVHDALLRPIAIFETGAGEPRQCVERLTYGHPGAGDPLRNQMGQLLRHDDPAGSLLLEGFSLNAQCTESTRHFTLDPVMPDWPEPVVDRQRLLEPGPGASSRWRFGALGHVLEQIDARGNRHAFGLTVEGRLQASRLLLHGKSVEQLLVSDIAYDADGHVEFERAGNEVQTRLAYRAEDGRLMARHTEDAGGRILQHLLYSYDPIGNVLSIEDQAQPIRYFANQRIDPVRQFGYDSLYQLVEATGWEAGTPFQGPESVGRSDPAAVSNYRQTYHYDAAGNLLELVHVGAQHHGHRMKAARYSNRCLPYRNGLPPTEDEIAAGFDARGNLLILEPGRQLLWNLRNQLQSVSPVQRDQEVYLYDGAGQRVRKIRSLRTRDRTVVADVRYLPGLELRTDDGTGEILEVVIGQISLNGVRLLHWESPPPSGINDRYRYAQTDHLGSVCLELTADVRIISEEHFYPFGETAILAGADTVEVSYKVVRYSGKERDATGLYYFGFRYYQAGLQRWLNPDPGGAIDGHNRYRAMRNSPLFFVDKDGRKPGAAHKDKVYHDLADQNLVHPIQAAGMQPIRRYFENDPNPQVQAYRSEIPRTLAKLGARDKSLLNTHQAHVIAAARTNTASPSGAVLYYSGEVLSSAMNQVVGEELTSRIMGPMSVAFNSPVEDPQVLAARRGAVASSFKVAGKLLRHAASPAAQIIGTAFNTMGNVMGISEAQTLIQYKQMSTPANPLLARDRPAVLPYLLPRTSLPGQSGTAHQTVLPAGTSELANRLFAVAFIRPSSLVIPDEVARMTDDSDWEMIRRSFMTG